MSDKPKANVQVDRITGKKEEQPPGKNYKVVTFTCDGYINGSPASNFLVKAIGKDKINAVVPGFSCTCDVDVFHNTTKYEIPRDWTPSQPTQSAPPPPPQSGRPAQARGQAMAVGLGMEEFDQIFTHAMDMVSQKLISLKITCGDGEELSADYETLAKLVPTYVIAAMDNGVRMTKVAPEQAPDAERAVDMNMVLEVLEKKGLTKRVEDANLDEKDLANMWKASGDSPLKFGVLVSETLTRRESGAYDSLPF